jgi:1-acyl-sn-glycerol-3-phosphate acyltransferase
LLRVLVAMPAMAVVTVACALAAVTGAAVDRSGLLAWRITRGWGRAVLALSGIRVSVHGAEHVPAGPAVFAANHGSALDIPILFGFLPAPFRIIHKRSLYLVPVLGLYLLLAGHVGIDRSNPFRARRSLDAAARRIAEGTSVVVFPEGTRSTDEAVRHFKRGSFVLAVRAGVPVVPVSLVGVKRVAPGGFLQLRPGTVGLALHAPRPTTDRDVEEAAAIAEEVRQIVSAGCCARA